MVDLLIGRSLVGKLREAEEFNDKIEQAKVGFLDDLRQYEKLPGYKPEMERGMVEAVAALENLPQIDVDEVQRYLITLTKKDYQSEGSVLNEAIMGRQTVEDTLEELSRVNKGVRRFTPRFKDEEHNERVEELHLLLEEDYLLQHAISTEGIFHPLNVVGGSLYGAMSGFGLTYGINLITSAQELSGLDSQTPLIEVAGYMSLIFGSIGVVIGSLSRSSNKDLPWNNAKYLDSRIKELL